MASFGDQIFSSSAGRAPRHQLGGSVSLARWLCLLLWLVLVPGCYSAKFKDCVVDCLGSGQCPGDLECKRGYCVNPGAAADVCGEAVKVEAALQASAYACKELTVELPAGEGDDRYTWRGSSELPLPEGLAIRGHKLVGTVAAAEYTVGLVAKDGHGREVSQNVELSVKACPTLPAACLNRDFEQQLDIEDLSEWSANVEDLPSGLSIDPNGRVSGKPTTAGVSEFELQALDLHGVFIQFPVKLEVTDCVSLSMALKDLCVGGAYTVVLDTPSAGLTPSEYDWELDVTDGEEADLNVDRTLLPTFKVNPLASGNYTLKAQVRERLAAASAEQKGKVLAEASGTLTVAECISGFSPKVIQACLGRKTTFRLNADVEDPDGNALSSRSWSRAGVWPEWAKLSGDGVLALNSPPADTPELQTLGVTLKGIEKAGEQAETLGEQSETFTVQLSNCEEVLPNACAGREYSAQLKKGHSVQGELPEGLEYDADTRTISGVPIVDSAAASDLDVELKLTPESAPLAIHGHLKVRRSCLTLVEPKPLSWCSAGMPTTGAYEVLSTGKGLDAERPPTWSIVTEGRDLPAGELPKGYSFDAGMLSVETDDAAANVSEKFTVTLTDSDDTVSTTTLSVTLRSPCTRYNAEGLLPTACIGVPYQAALTSDPDAEDQWGLPLIGQTELDGWLSIDAGTGELSGTPRGPARVLKDFSVAHKDATSNGSTPHSIPIEPCKYAYLDEDNRLFLGDLRATADEPPEGSDTVELTEGLDGEANRFEFSPDGTVLAFGVNSVSEGTLFISNMRAPTPEQLDLGDGENAAALVHELAWSDDGTHLSVVWKTSADEAFVQDFLFDPQSGTPSNGAVIGLPLWSYQLHWLQYELCYFGNLTDNKGLYCHEVSAEGAVTSVYNKWFGAVSDLVSARVLDMGERAIVSIPRRVGENDTKYGSFYFSDGMRGNSLEFGIVAPSLDQLAFYSRADLHEEEGRLFDYSITLPASNRLNNKTNGRTANLEHCSRLKGWSRSGKKLVCADDTDYEDDADDHRLWVITLNAEHEFVEEKRIENFAETNIITARTLFSADDRWLAFDSYWGLVVVDTGAETLEARLLEKDGGERSFRALDAGRWLWQVDTKLFLVDGSLSGDPTETLLSAPLTALAMPSTCHPEQYIQSPLEWCGGYAGNDQFVVAGDYSAVVFPTTGGGLYALRLPADPTASVGTATRVSDVNVTCPDDGCSATLKFQN